MHLFNIQGFSSMWKNHTQSQHPVSVLLMILVTLLLNSIPFSTSTCLRPPHCGCVGTSKLVPKMLNEVEVRTAGKPIYPLHTEILDVVTNKPLCLLPACGDTGLPQIIKNKQCFHCSTYCQEALFQQRKSQPKPNFPTFCFMFKFTTF